MGKTQVQVTKELPDPFKAGKWTAETLQQVFDHVEWQIERELDWYRTRKRSKALVSSLLRGFAIAMFVLGGLVPLVQAASQSNLGQLGYILLGMGAGLMGFDKFFGSSTGWMRYTATMLAIERTQMEFRLDWIRAAAALEGREPNTAEVTQFLEHAKHVLVDVRALIDEETKAWAAEFQKTLEQLESQLRARADEAQKQAQGRAQAAKDAVISVTISNGAEADDGFEIFLDGQSKGREHGISCQLLRIPPGDHIVKAAATIGGLTAFDSKTARVAAGALVEVKLTLVKAKKATN